MANYIVCPRCFQPVRDDWLQGRLEWVCSHCKKTAEVSDEFGVEIRSTRRVARRLFWIGVGLSAALVGAGVAAKFLGR